MILNDREIKTALDARDIIVSPILDEDNQLGAGSLDVRLGTRFLVLRQVELGEIDPMELRGGELWRYYQEEVVRPGGKFILHPGQLVLATTFEFVALPKNVAAQVHGRSSWGRAGLIIATAAYIHPGFRGWITLEMVNEGNVPIVVYPLMRIAQLAFMRTVSDSAPRPKGKYYGAPAPTAIGNDVEITGRRLVPQERPVLIGCMGHVGAGQRTLAEQCKRKFGFRALDLLDPAGSIFTELERSMVRRKAHADSPLKLVRTAEPGLVEMLDRGDPVLVLNISTPDEVRALVELGCRGFIRLDSDEGRRRARLEQRGLSDEAADDLLQEDALISIEECYLAATESSVCIQEGPNATEEELQAALGTILDFAGASV